MKVVGLVFSQRLCACLRILEFRGTKIGRIYYEQREGCFCNFMTQKILIFELNKNKQRRSFFKVILSIVISMDDNRRNLSYPAPLSSPCEKNYQEENNYSKFIILSSNFHKYYKVT